MGLQTLAILLDAREHHGRNWKHDPRRRELALHEHVMNETAMKSAVAVLKRMNVHEGKCGCRRLEHRIKRRVTHAIVGFDHPCHQVVQILRARANELWQGFALVISLSEKHSVRSQTGLDE